MGYSAHQNATRAAKDAGYKHPHVAGCKLLKHPLVKRYLGKLEQETQERFEATKEEIIEHLSHCATRDAKQLFDENGILVLNHQVINGEVEGSTIHDLPEQITVAIDSVKQKVRRWVEGEDEIEEVETELRLVSKASAIEMAMKHKGLFAPDSTR